jgi:hypothetical protein
MSNDRLRVAFHGSVLWLLGLLCGFATVTEEEPVRLWHTAHETLILMGLLLMAVSSVLPVLVLGEREARALPPALLAMGYGFAVALVVQAVTGVHVFEPRAEPLPLIGFAGNVVGVLGSLMSALLTLAGLRAARAAAAAPAPAPARPAV